jgi:HK97 gp10 family phage protein
MAVRSKITLNSSFFSNLNKSEEKGLLSSANFLKDKIKHKLNRSGGVSAIGTPPVKKSGDLQESITIDSTEIKSKRVKIGSDEDYAASLEAGTLKMQPRPYLRPSYRENKKGVLEKFNKGGK